MPLRRLFRFASRRAHRRPACVAGVVQHLERRTLLSGSGSTCVITATDGGSVTIDASQFDNAVVVGSADIGALTINTNGPNDGFKLNIQDGASVTSLQFNGGDGSERVRIGADVSIGSVQFNGNGGQDLLVIRSGTETGSVTFNSGDGPDTLIIEGTIGTSLNIQGGRGGDTVLIQNGGRVVGDTGGSLGGGDDQFIVRGSETAIANIDLDLGEGSNRFTMLDGADASVNGSGNFKLTAGGGDDTVRIDGGSGTVVDDLTSLGDDPDGTLISGNFTLDLGDGDDLANFTGLVDVDGNMQIDARGGADRILFEQLALQGNQTINLGDSPSGDGTAGPADVIEFGQDLIEGGSSVNAIGRLSVTETAAREVTSDVSVNQTQPGSRAYVSFDQGSTYGGNLSISTQDQTSIYGQFTVEMGNATLMTGTGSGTGSDKLVLRDGTRIEGNANITMGDSSDESADQVVFGDVEVTGNMQADLGAGDDSVRFGALTLGGNQTLSLGTGSDFVRFGEDDIDGSSTVNVIGEVTIEEGGARMIQSDYVVNATINSSDPADTPQRIMLGGGSTVMGNVNLQISGRGDVRANMTTTMGNVTVNTAAAGDTIDLSGLTVENGNNLNVSSSGGNDTVMLGGATVTGNANIGLGGGDDMVDNAGFTVDGTATFTGGAGNDTITNPDQGNQSGFEG